MSYKSGLFFFSYRTGGLLQRVPSHVVSLAGGRRHRKCGEKWKRQIKISTVFHPLEITPSHLTITLPFSLLNKAQLHFLCICTLLLPWGKQSLVMFSDLKWGKVKRQMGRWILSFLRGWVGDTRKSKEFLTRDGILDAHLSTVQLWLSS